MSNFTKSILYSATVLAVGLVAIFSIYSNVSTSPDASVAAIEPATGEVTPSDIEMPANPAASAETPATEEGAAASETPAATDAAAPAEAAQAAPAAEGTEAPAAETAEALPADSAIPAGSEEIASPEIEGLNPAAPVQLTIDAAAKEAEAAAATAPEAAEPSAGSEAVPALVPTEE